MLIALGVFKAEVMVLINLTTVLLLRKMSLKPKRKYLQHLRRHLRINSFLKKNSMP